MKVIFISILFSLLSIAVYSQQKLVVERTSSAKVVEKQLLVISKIYPNPVRNVVNIQVGAASDSKVTISLYNIMGAKVMVWQPFELSNGEQILNLDLSEFVSGVYILKFESGSTVISQVIKKV
jgi:hypothetical protein